MSSPSSAICPSVIVAEAIKSAVIGDAQEPYGATFCSGIRCPLLLHRHSRLLIGSIPARGSCTMEYTCTRLVYHATVCGPAYLPQPSPPDEGSRLRGITVAKVTREADD